MKKYTLLFLFFISLLSACGGKATEAPIIVSTAPPIPTLEPTATPPTEEVFIPTDTPTEETVTVRISAMDGMPQVFIPAGTFHMGGYVIRAAPDEFPAHEVTIDA